MAFTNILQWNCEGIKAKFAGGDILQLIKETDTTCLCLQETKLAPDAKFNIKKFKAYLKNLDVEEDEHSHGGVAIFIRNHISSYQVPLRTTLQAVAVSVKCHKRITLCSLYLPPVQAEREQDVQRLKQEMQSLLDQLPKPFIVLGDFNAHHQLWYDPRDVNKRGEMIVSLVEENDIALLDRNKVTSIWKVDKTFSHVDLALCSTDLLSVFHWDVHDEPLSSDHFPILLKSGIQVNSGGCQRWIPDKADWASYMQKTDVDKDVEGAQSVDDAAEVVESLLIDAAKDTIPKTSGKGGRKSPPWWSGKCWIAVKKRKNAFRRFARRSSVANYNSFSCARASARRVIKACKKESWERFIGGINSKSRSGEMHRRIRMLNNRHVSEAVTTLKLSLKLVTITNIPRVCHQELIKEVMGIGCVQTSKVIDDTDQTVSVCIRFESDESVTKVQQMDGSIVEGFVLRVLVTDDSEDEPPVLDDPKDIADCLGSRFAYVSGDHSCDPRFKELRDRLDNERINFNTVEKLGYNSAFTMNELEFALSNSDDSSPGPDDVIYSMLKNLSSSGKVLLLQLINRIYKEGKMPKRWKEAYIIPILKEGKVSTDPGSYRPIALTSCISKILGKMVNRRLVRILESKGHFDKHQSGSRKGRSTVDNLAALSTEAHNAFRRSQYLFTVFFDLAKAYDTCWKRLILDQLYKFGLRGELPRFIEDYLTGRKFRVRVGHTYSEQYEQKMGVPQGGVLSCTLFTIAINTVAEVIRGFFGVTYSLYVDDKRISFATDKYKEAVTKIQGVLDELLRWSLKTGFKFSLEKTVWMVFYRNIHPIAEPIQLLLDGIALKEVTEKKFLGVIFDRMLSFKKHVQYVRGKAMRAMSIMSMISRGNRGTDAKTLLNIYRSVVRSKLDYACQVYGTAPQSYLRPLDPVHHKGLRICLGAYRTSPFEGLYVLSNEPSLTYRRDMLQLQYYVRTKQFLPNDVPVRLDDKSLDARYSKKSSMPVALGYKVRCLSVHYGIEYPNIALLQESKVGPWDLPSLEICMVMASYLKSETSPEKYQKTFLSHRHDVDIEIYTDGSKCSEGVGSGVVTIIGRRDHGLGRRLHNTASVYSAELYAIQLALQSLKFRRNVVCAIYTDSRSSLQAISNSSRNGFVREILEIVVELHHKGVRVIFCWIPGHAGIKGNELADKEAKLAVGQNIVRTQEISVSDVKSCIKQKVYEKWRSQWEKTTVEKVKLKEVIPVIGRTLMEFGLSRSESVKLSRLQLGHTRFTHSHHYTGEDVPVCDECDVVISVKHILLECGSNALIRLEYYDHREVTLRDLLTKKELIVKVLAFLKDIDFYKLI